MSLAATAAITRQHVPHECDEHTPLHAAAARGDAGAVKALLVAGAEVDTGGRRDRTALVLAAAAGHIEVGKLLLAAGADPDAALCVAVATHQDSFVDLLVKQDFAPFYQDENGMTALHHAARRGLVELSRLLMRNWASPAEKSHEGKMAWDYARANGFPKLAEYFETQFESVRPREWGQRTVEEQLGMNLFDALEVGDTARVRRLIEDGAVLSMTNLNGLLPLHRAIQLHNLDAVESLILAGADVNTAAGGERTPIAIAAAVGDPIILKMLLAAGATPTPEALSHASFGNRTEALAVLLSAGGGVDVNCPDNDGWTPLHRAAGEGNTEVVLQLLNQGAGLSAKTSQGFTPRDCAIMGNHETTLKAILAWEDRRSAGGRLIGFSTFDPTYDEASLLTELLKVLERARETEIREFREIHCKHHWRKDRSKDLDALTLPLIAHLKSWRDRTWWYSNIPSKCDEAISHLESARRHGDFSRVKEIEHRLRGCSDYCIPPGALLVYKRLLDEVHAHAQEKPAVCCGMLVERSTGDYLLGIHEVRRFALRTLDDVPSAVKQGPIILKGPPLGIFTHAVYIVHGRRSAEFPEGLQQRFLSHGAPVLPAIHHVVLAASNGQVCEMRPYQWEWTVGEKTQGRFVPVDLHTV